MAPKAPRELAARCFNFEPHGCGSPEGRRQVRRGFFGKPMALSLNPPHAPAGPWLKTPAWGVDAAPEVFRASLLNGADSKINGMVNPLNVTDQLFRSTDITGVP